MDRTAARFEVDIAPDVLVWARETIGLSRDAAAKKLAMLETDLRLLEEGVGNVSIPRLRRMADVYHRPLLAFFLPAPPNERDHLPDFRMMPGSRGKPWSPELHEAYRRVIGQREVVLELAALADEPAPTIDLHLRSSEDVDAAGERVRAWLAPPERFASNDPYTVLNTWVSLIEEKAVLVTQVSGVPTEEMRGFSVGEHPFPVISLNGADFPRGKVFTLMHELVHILLRRSALCDLEDVPTVADPDAQRLEWFCNTVAAAVLMSRQVMLREPLVTHASVKTHWSDEDLSYLAGRFGVSTEALLLRLVTLNRASREFYRQKRPLFVRLYQERREQSTGRLTYYPRMIRNLGRRYISSVWSAYERGDISDDDVSTYLQVKHSNVPKLIQRMGGET